MMTRKACFLLLFALLFLAIPAISQAQVAVGISIRVGPPPLPVYVQPPPPYPGYIWTPGYWAYGPDGYYWVPGTWVEPPVVGVLWTPGYCGWRDGFYVWNAGYWGPHVGFYGGINYGFGYTGVGFVGGAWRGGVYSYNRAVTNVNTTNVTIVHNTYNTTVVNNNTTVVNNHTSFNGGPGGINARPTMAEQQAFRDHHIAPTNMQMQHQQSAGSNRQFLASVNHGAPSVAASSRAGEFSGRGVTAAHNANRSMNTGNGNGPKNEMMRNDRPSRATNGDSWNKNSDYRTNDRSSHAMNGDSWNRGSSPAYKTNNSSFNGNGNQNYAIRNANANNSHARVQEVHNMPHPPKNQQQGNGRERKDKR